LQYQQNGKSHNWQQGPAFTVHSRLLFIDLMCFKISIGFITVTNQMLKRSEYFPEDSTTNFFLKLGTNLGHNSVGTIS
jgi:hypothetical protein